MTSVQLTGHRDLRGRSPLSLRRLALTSAMVAAGFAGWLAATVDEQPVASSPRPVTAVVAAPASVGSEAQPPAREFQRSGQIVALSDDTVTMATDGRLTTFRVTPQTTRITVPGAETFAPAQSVVVLGIVRDGVAVATAIADERAVGPDGPPMDYQLPV
ncbi:hypothetical protein [Mycolicibacterium duvalii]|uniref:DUF5666 domain-containing protein n=1 Tax=Mycolicibacterium duvalii TaxID=39688 RepID=A0A7I7K7V9_9MYCO|nr:hypothetical protein [Mycolicibacterium duvalii]MCV7366158.1 hypothetical protein [Mycolicibacterium duvalii]BBX19608.1 hypothetical protein MDUV_44680 [Mycolicibacterium duvalii]